MHALVGKKGAWQQCQDSRRAAVAVCEALERRWLLSGYAESVLGSFNGINGGFPQGSLVMDSAGNLYGASSSGGATDQGTVFEVPHGRSSIVALAAFNAAPGSYLNDQLAIDSSGDLFGTAVIEGDTAEILEIPRGSYSFTVLAHFSTAEVPAAPITLDSAGDIFGTTVGDGKSMFPTIFELAKNSPSITTVATFSDNAADVPNPLLVDSDAEIFGTVANNGSAGDGTIFEVPAGAHTISTLATFTGDNGSSPTGALVDSGGDLFGTTAAGVGSAQGGTLFKLHKVSGNILTLVDLGGATLSQPSGPIQDSAGDLFGTTRIGGIHDAGTLFELPLDGTTAIALYSFNDAGGELPTAPIIDPAGNIYGATFSGGAHDQGTVFKFPPPPHVGPPAQLAFSTEPTSATAGTTLSPSITVSVEDTNGNVVYNNSSTVTLSIATGPAGAALNGTLSAAAVNGIATFTNLSLTQIGAYTLRASDATLTRATSVGFSMAPGMTGDVATPIASIGQSTGGIVRDSAGDLFGTTQSGSVFEVPVGAGVMETLASFNSNGADPTGPLLLDSAGDIYGVTRGGGAHGLGVVYEIVAGSYAITDLASFTTDNGSNSVTAIDGNGNLFGTSQSGGAFQDGSIFEIARGSGKIKTLASFNVVDGQNPVNGVVDNAGDLFGLTSRGGPSGDGVLYELSSGATAVTVLAAFNGSNGAHPTGNLVIDSDGDRLFGTTSAGGDHGDGTIFDLSTETNTIITHASFNGNNGSMPNDLVMDSAGDLIGIAGEGGPDSQGAVFELPSGSNNIQTLLAFAPQAPLAIDPLGNLFAVSGDSIARFSPTTVGDTDPTFDAGGVSSLAVGLNTTAGVVLQSDGKSVVTGTTGAAGSQSFGVIRYNTDGSLDTSFGNHGVAQTSFGGNDVPSAIVLLADGDILVAGTATTIVNGHATGSRFALAEFTPAGKLDTGFGYGTGRVETSFSSTASLYTDVGNAIFVWSNGTIYVGGSSRGAGARQNFAIAAYLPNGSPDASFGKNGKVLLASPSGDGSISALASPEPNQLIAAGSVTNPSSGVTSVAIEAFIATTGAIDRHFGNQGSVVTSVGRIADSASSIVIHNGCIFVGGASATGSAAAGTLSSDFLLLEYGRSGQLLSSFGNYGIVLTPITGHAAAITHLALDSSGRIVAFGNAASDLATLNVSQLDLTVARYNSNGTLDSTFNGTGFGVYRLSNQPPVGSDATLNAEVTRAATTSQLTQELAALTASTAGVGAISDGGDLFDVGTSGTNTVEAAIIATGIDLAVSLTASLPASVVTGKLGTAAVNIIESGESTVTGTLAIVLLVSGQSAAGTTQVIVHSLRESMTLKANVLKVIHLSFRYLASIPHGTYSLVANVEISGVRNLNPVADSAASATTVTVT